MLTAEILGKLKIDECDLPLLHSRRWNVTGTKSLYISSYTRLPDSREGKIFLHCLILNAPPELQVDHINGDTFDNRRSNLRLCTREQNQYNRRKTKLPTSSVYKGVCWHKGVGKWIARIRVNGALRHLGYFQDEISAARSYDSAAIKFFKDFAKPNFIIDE